MQFDINCDVPLYSDSHRLSVILDHLLSNSIKYKDNRKSSQLIGIKASVSPTSAIISIHDNGVGIHPDYLPNVSNMFYRANEKSDGAGLGLYVVSEVVQKLKGTMVITSAYGEWTNVEISLP